jgi:4-amino-4-deoxy-L-arabinose transferase-like glycosyltransferase
VSVSRDELRQILVLGVLCVFLFFFGLANFGLVGADEPRYAQIAREMLERNDWVTPRLYGDVWLEKPVLYYWLEMVAYKIFGVSDWAARLPAAVLGAILIAAIYAFCRRFRPGLQMESAVISASSIGIFSFARGVSTDMPLAVCFTLSLLAWWAFVETQRRGWLLGFYCCLALATLAKGPVAMVLATLVIGAFALITRDGSLILRTLWLPGIAAFCAVALPWYVLVQLRNPQFFSEFILRHNLARFSTDLFRHQGPWWYFIPVLLVGLLPWTAFALLGAAHSFRKWRLDRDRYALFLLAWAVIPMLFFSFSESKLAGYILPAIPAWTLLAAEYLRFLRAQAKFPVSLIFLHGLGSAVLAATVVLVPRFMLDRHAPLSLQTVLLTVSLAAVAFLVVAGLVLWRGLRLLRFATLLPLLVCVAYVLRVAAPVIDATQSARPVAKSLEELQRQFYVGTMPDSPIAVLGVSRALEYGAGFYRSRKIARYERGEFPGGDYHLLVARSGTEQELAAILAQHTGNQLRCDGREHVLPYKATMFGELKPARIRYYRVVKPWPYELCKSG